MKGMTINRKGDKGAGKKVSSHLTNQIKCFTDPFNLFHMFSWKESMRKHLERGRKSESDWTNLLSVEFKADQSDFSW